MVSSSHSQLDQYTPLKSHHGQLGAKFGLFAGWLMPIYYPKGAMAEHLLVRQKAGLFDLSHMGRIDIEGPECIPFLEYLSTNHIAKRSAGSATYTLWCDEWGQCLEDLIIYRVSDSKAFLIANAANRHSDLAHLTQYSTGWKVVIRPCWDEEGILALQGPLAEPIAKLLFPQLPQLAPMRFTTANFSQKELIIASTGYTGAGGYEFFVSKELLAALWEKLLALGSSYGLEAVGLAARDSLRLEAGFALYGHELCKEIIPSESVAAWAVRFDKDFLGKSALLAEKGRSKRQAAGYKIDGKAIARQSTPLFWQDRQVGVVTSGGYSPCLACPIALALIDSTAAGQILQAKIREHNVTLSPVKLPFIRKA